MFIGVPNTVLTACKPAEHSNSFVTLILAENNYFWPCGCSTSLNCKYLEGHLLALQEHLLVVIQISCMRRGTEHNHKNHEYLTGYL